MENDARRCASWLLRSFETGDRICVWAPNVPEWVVLQYGAALAGVVLVTANPAFKPSELEFVLRQSRSSALFHLANFRGVDTGAVAREIENTALRRFDFDGWLDQIRSMPATPLPEIDPGHTAQIQYTSGITGRPKGALLHHRGLVTNASYVAARAGLEGSVLLSPMPLFHTAGSVMSVLGCMTSRATLVLPLFFDPPTVLQAIEATKAEIVFGVPTMLFARIDAMKTAPRVSPRELKDVAEDFRKKLYQLSRISKVELLGVQDERVWLELDTRKLAAVGVHVNSLIKDLQGQNVVLPSGNINANGTRLLLETSGDFPNVRAIETLLTRVGTTDSLVRLADLVTVRRDSVSPKVKPIYFNGRPAIVLSVVMQPDQDVTQLGRKLRAASSDYERRLPIGYAIDLATYQADQVSASVNSALSSVAQTFSVVAVLVVLFLGLRAGTVAAMIVPFAVMFSLIGMRALGIALE
ncbi:efflux RND transporter permease subunit [Bradyrhizobium sp. SHOUNA76]|uniref:efflux RND transporter permease subunit n=1 Tax=Bradyrhizobium sp. SHOUNA76 TaxID=2908927 RepID=UPI001FF59F5A|nr:efflux RND transporter permease subunit [Bradyrhizobium sp. SHOUNA76]MCJ9700006.1 efflux RND transporter permease subunit [Bradyrhizobium sp. SHOUNA76]